MYIFYVHFICKPNYSNKYPKHLLQIGISVSEYAERRKRECEQHGITWQPQVLVLGPDALHIEQVFVLMNDVVFPISSTVKAVDICFKLFQVFNIEYPVECRLAWLCIQRARPI